METSRVAVMPQAADTGLLRASWAERLAQLALACGAWGLLALSASLTPSPEGLGTHEQLGMAPCTFHQLTGQPCPSCGMTTAFALMAHGRVFEAAIVHPFGALLFALVLASAVVLSVCFAVGRSVKLWCYSTKTPLVIYALILLWLAGWGFKVAYGAITGGYAA
jgi:hypothetical protein